LLYYLSYPLTRTFIIIPSLIFFVLVDARVWIGTFLDDNILALDFIVSDIIIDNLTVKDLFFSKDTIKKVRKRRIINKIYN